MKRKIFSFALLLCLLLPLGSSYAETFGRTVTIYAPAVSTVDGEYVGVIGEMNVSISEGNGSVFVETWPLSELDTQASARIAASVSSSLSGIQFSNYNFYYSIKSASSVVGGPSAGATLTIASIAAIEGWDLDPDVMMTGMINTDGTVGPVGGIYEKALAAHEFGITTFLVPEGQAQVSVGEATIDLTTYAPDEWGMDVVEVFDIEEAIFYFTGNSYEREVLEGAVPDTSFFSEDVLAELDETETYAQQLATSLFDSSVESSIAEDLTSYMVSAQEKLDDARAAADVSRYYSALSYIFQARISLSYVKNAVVYLTSENEASELDSILDDVGSYITVVSGDVEEFSSSVRGFSSLEAFSAAQERIYEAGTVLDDAEMYAALSSPADALYNAALAFERTRTAAFWLSVAKDTASGDLIDISVLQYGAETLINDANLTLVYVSELISTPNSLLTEAQELLLAAQEEYNNKSYAAALFDASEGKAMAATAIELYACEESNLDLQIERVKENAGQAILSQMSNGITPILSISYYEFANEYEEEGNLYQAKIYYKYSFGIATAFRYLQGGDASEIDFTDTLDDDAEDTGDSIPAATAAVLIVIGVVVGASVMYLAKRKK